MSGCITSCYRQCSDYAQYAGEISQHTFLNLPTTFVCACSPAYLNSNQAFQPASRPQLKGGSLWC